MEMVSRSSLGGDESFAFGELPPNNILQGTFEQWTIFAGAKTFPASNAPERKH